MNKLTYYSTFYDINNNKCKVEIYKNTDDNITAKELTLAKQAVTIQYSSDDLFQPLKQSGCTINVLTKDILTDLYTGKLNEVTCKIFKNDKLFWFGFLTPNIYSSEFESDLDLLQLEFIDVISHLDDIKFKTSDNAISSFYDVMVKAFSTIDTEHVINNIYSPNSILVDGYADILKRFYIQDRNFLDEEEEPQTYKEVLEDILRYLGMTLIQYEDKFLILDYEYIKANDYHYTVFKIDDNTAKLEELEKDCRTLTDIGVSSTNATISLGNIYNKVTIVANSNPIGDIVPDLFDDLTNQNADANKYYEKEIKENVYLASFFNSSQYSTGGIYCGFSKIDKEVTIDLLWEGLTTFANNGGITSGAFFQKNENYKTEDGKPSSLNWADYLTFAKVGAYNQDSDYITVTKKSSVFKGGYFIIDLEYMLSLCPLADCTETNNGREFKIDKYTAAIVDTNFKALLQIGEYYYNGEEWTTTLSYFYLCHKNKEGEQILSTFYKLTNQVSYEDDLIDSGDGVLIKLPDNVLTGDLYFELHGPSNLGKDFNYSTHAEGNSIAYYCHIKDLKFIHTTKNEHYDVFNENNNESDVLYENVIDGNNITELDDITMKVNTYSPTVSSYSYVLKKVDKQYDFVDTVTKSTQAEPNKMEVFNIGKYVDYYSLPKFIYSNSLNNKDVKPYSIIHSTVINKNMIVDAASYDLSNDSVDVTLKEI